MKRGYLSPSLELIGAFHICTQSVRGVVAILAWYNSQGAHGQILTKTEITSMIAYMGC